MKTSRPIPSLLLGLLATLLVLGAHLAGWDKNTELSALDVRFNFSLAGSPDHIVHIDIDDGSLAALGRWPWPRELQAGILDTLAGCGARAVVMDIIMPDPQEVRFVSAASEIYGDRQSDLVGKAEPVPVFDDAILAATVRRRGNVFIPMAIDIDAAEEKTELETAIEQALKTNPGASLEAVRASVPIARKEGGGAKLQKAYLLARAIASVQRFALPNSSAIDMPLRSGPILPAVVTLADAAGGSGYVTFKPDDDKVLRRIPLLCRSEGRVFPQFAFAVAARELAWMHGGRVEIFADASGVTITCADGTKRTIPVDSDGYMLINWARGTWPPQEAVPAAAVHLSATGVAGVWKAEQKPRLNRREARIVQTRIAEELNYTPLLNLFRRGDSLHQQLIARTRERYVAMLYDPAKVPPEPLELKNKEKLLEADIDKVAAQLRKELDEFYLAAAPPAGASHDVREKYERLLRLRNDWDEILARDKPDKAARAKRIRELRALVSGKICMVGSTATGAADFVATPLDARLPGVVVHSNIVNTILTGNFIREAGPAPAIAVIMVAGVLVAFLTATRPVFVAVPGMLLLAAGYTAFNMLVVFAVWKVWLIVVAPVAAMLASFIFVTAYRQLTEERAKRQIKDMFAHALSPALVDRLIEDPSLAELGGQKRTLTCMFSDLAGFTPLSEQLGPQDTVRLLNRYFDRVTEVVQENRGGYLNKFLGDGIFAFFGAPVFQKDHTARAIHAAVDCQHEVARLNEELSTELSGTVELHVRIGIAAGEAMVGNCGSTKRMDYTAIGDCVNLSSRLEGSNKFFGSRILVDRIAWEMAHITELPYRSLGRAFITGIRDPVELWEVQPPADGDADKQREALAEFSRAIELFYDGRFSDAIDVLEEVQKVLPHDKATRAYLELCTECVSRGSEEWEPQLELGKGVERIAMPWDCT